MPDHGLNVEVKTTNQYQTFTHPDGSFKATQLSLTTRPGGASGLPRTTQYVYGVPGVRPHQLSQVIENGISTTNIVPFVYPSSFNGNGLIQATMTRDLQAGNAVLSSQSFNYDIYGQMTTRNTQLDTVQPLAVETWSYFATGNPGQFPKGYLESYTDQRGKQTKYEVDKLGRRTRTILPALDEVIPEAEANRDWTYQYNVNGQVVKTFDPLSTGVSSHVTSAAYDLRQLPVSAIAADGTMSTVGYDAARNPVFATDALGRTTKTEYDSRNRPIRVTNALGQSVRSYYDAAGRVVVSVDPLGAPRVSNTTGSAI